jgi:hypothetical protein
MEQLRQAFAGSRNRRASTFVALHGLGGVGKTRLGIEYGLQQEENYSALLLISARTPGLLKSNLAELVGPLILDLPEKEARDNEEKINAALNWLEQNPRWFLILDNIDNAPAAAAMQALLPKLVGGDVLVIGRVANFGAEIVKLELGVLDSEHATSFLLERTMAGRRAATDDESRARELAEQLGRLALALKQAGAYIERQRRFVARINIRAQSGPRSDIYVRRTYSGRPSSSIRFSEATAMATSVICRPSVRERSASPITRL